MKKICEIKNQIIFLLNDNFNKNINLGIELLRTLMSFSIVILHFLKPEYRTNNLIKFIFHAQTFYVPTFFLISFYFSFNTFISKKISKIKERFIRILIPYTIWPIFLWLRKTIKVSKNIRFNYKTFKPIIIQLLIGYDFYAVLWFQFDLIFITLIITIIRFIFNKKHTIMTFKIIIPLFYIFNKYYEQKLSIYDQIGSIRPLLNSTIFCLTGFFLGYYSILKRINSINHKKYLLLILLIFSSFFIYIHRILIKISSRFYTIIVSFVIFCNFICFSLLPFESIKRNIIKKLIKYLTSYTGGIYYLHYGVREIFSNYFKIFDAGDFKSCLINYICCYFICFIGSNLLKKSKLKYLFL